MFNYIWPLALVVASNIIYHICTHATAGEIHPLASLTVTYLVGAVVSALVYYLLNPKASILHEFTKVNWASFVLGIVIVGLEVGYIYAYRAGWEVSVASVVQSAVLSVALIAVGVLLYHEQLTWNKLVGIGICLVGLVFINIK